MERGSNPKTKQLYWQQLNLHLTCIEDLFGNDTPSVPIDYPIDIGKYNNSQLHTITCYHMLSHDITNKLSHAIT